MRILVERRALLVVIAAAAALAGCTELAPEGEEALGAAESELLAYNALSVNALSVNALSVNALGMNALQYSALSPGSISAIRDPGPSGDDARMFVKYAMACAGTTNDTFEFTWTDANNVNHPEVYPGELGIAPEWMTGSLSSSGEHRVSACLGAFVNAHGLAVLISMRSPEAPLKAIDPDELEDYADIEGAFWGNLFLETPQMYACYNEATIANSRAYHRECATGILGPNNTTTECGIIEIVGRCSDVCDPVTVEGHYPSCLKQPGQGIAETEHVITVGLP